VKVRDEFGDELRVARTAKGLSLEAASRAAKISQGYLHKLEAGRVENPSPRVLQRLGDVVGVSYRRLMELADYLMPDELPGPSGEHPVQEVEMAAKTKTETERAPTNRELARLLETVLRELADLRRAQEDLARALRRPSA
jgi:transcriptional regulator with XRE-family HTH domain